MSRLRSHLVVLTAVLLVVSGCVETPRPIIFGHRGHGAPNAPGENPVLASPELFSMGFGVEIDIRADGERPFELGHNGPQGDNLEDVFDVIEDAFTDDFVGRTIILDIADDENDGITNGLIPYLAERIPGTRLEDLQYIVQVSQEPSLLAMRTQAEERALPFTVEFAFTQWLAPEYTVPPWVDYLVGNINEMPTYPFPKPLILFGVATRSSYEQVVNHPAEVYGVLTDHPRRIKTFQPD